MNLPEKATQLARSVIRDEITALEPSDLDCLRKGAGSNKPSIDLLAHMCLRNRARKVGIFAEIGEMKVVESFIPMIAVA